MSEAKYDDREIVFTEIHEHKKRLSELTEREREIFFAGVADGGKDATKIFMFIMFLVVVTVFIAVACCKYQWL